MKRTILAAAMAAFFALGTASAQFVAGGNGMYRRGGGYGPGDGTGNQGQRPRDGSGKGAKAGKRGAGQQTCDGSRRGARR